MSYLLGEVETDSNQWAKLQPWVEAMLSDFPVLPPGDFPIEAAETDGVLPWLAFKLHEAGLLSRLENQQKAIRRVLTYSGVLHMYSERELERLALLADDVGVEFLVFKGHAVARTLYQHTACRLTSDFDLVVAPDQLDATREWLLTAGYEPYGPFVGTHWLAARTWVPRMQGNMSITIDLHWDISNRMYYRHRLDIGDLVRNAQRIQLGEASIRVPGLFDDAIIACIHLAAFSPGLPVTIRWLLDIRLLLARIDESEIEQFVKRAEETAAIEACLVFGELAAKLDNSESLASVLGALRNASSVKRMAVYDRTLRSRSYDLLSYWQRLPGVSAKIGLLADGIRWLRS